MQLLSVLTHREAINFATWTFARNKNL